MKSICTKSSAVRLLYVKLSSKKRRLLALVLTICVALPFCENVRLLKLNPLSRPIRSVPSVKSVMRSVVFAPVDASAAIQTKVSIPPLPVNEYRSLLATNLSKYRLQNLMRVLLSQTSPPYIRLKYLF